MTTIYLQRHGLSVSNLQYVCAGHSDFELCELGFKQAEAAAEVLCKRPITAIYSSDLKRAYQTASAVGRKLNLPVTQVPALREIFAGSLESRSYADLATVCKEEYDRYKADPCGCGWPEGENAMEVLARFVPAMKEIAEKHDGETVLVTSHSTAISIFLSEVQGVMYRLGLFPIKNTAITTLTYENGLFTVQELGNADHLTEELLPPSRLDSLPKEIAEVIKKETP